MLAPAHHNAITGAASGVYCYHGDVRFLCGRDTQRELHPFGETGEERSKISDRVSDGSGRLIKPLDLIGMTALLRA